MVYIMKLKYKKVIMLTTMSTMLIGLLTLSISKDNSKAEEATNTDLLLEADTLIEEDNNIVTALAETRRFVETASIPEPTATPIPTPTPMPIFDFEKEADPEIHALFEDYFTAKKSCDVDKIKSLLTNQAKAPSVEELQSKTEYIDDYRNVKTYLKKGPIEDTFIAYVYQEIKFTGVNTMAPGLSKFYLVKEEGQYKIFSDEMDTELVEYYDARNEDADVKELLDKTNQRGEEAKANDEDLKNFWDSIDKLASEQMASNNSDN
ncbi:MAG: hypothetical protein GX915_04580 [Clostridiales bacterium]|nr:hypothetical protein [Clostridiales bacterium]